MNPYLTNSLFPPRLPSLLSTRKTSVRPGRVKTRKREPKGHRPNTSAPLFSCLSSERVDGNDLK